jgi:hypothetical protein
MKVIERYTNPSKHVLESFGTVVKNGDSYFIQVSKDPECSEWLTLGELLEVIHPGSDLSDKLIEEYLEIYENKITKIN